MITKKKNQTWFRYLIGQLHLWLGLASGLVVLIVSITGCLFVFQTEISDVYYKKIFFVTPQEKILPLSVLKQKADSALGVSKPVENIVTYKQPDKAWEFMAYKMNDTATTYFGTTEYFESVYINPYTGDVTGRRDYRTDFFTVVKYLHWSLLLNTKYGQPIVGWSTLIFVVLLITGMVLWWPKKWNKKTKDASFKINWKAKFKRFNYDLHNVLGFYSLIPALIIALTGMVFAFSWFMSLTYAAASGTTTYSVAKETKSIEAHISSSTNPMDIAFAEARVQFPDAKRIGISPVKTKDATLNMYGFKGKEVYYNNDELKFDQYSGKLLERNDYVKKNRGEKLLEMNYDIHVGAIAGLTGKIIAFLASLISASLPVTGFLVWWNKRKRKGTGALKTA